MSAANESQGLKIVVAAFMTLAVILLATSCFLYSAYAEAKAGRSAALKQYEELRRKIGARANDHDQINEEIVMYFKGIDDRLRTLAAEVTAAVAKAQTAGDSGPELEESKHRIQQLIDSYHNDPRETYISSFDRFAEMLENLSVMTTQLSIDYVDVRHALESSTMVTREIVGLHTKAAENARQDVIDEHKMHEDERVILLSKVDSLSSAADRMAIEIANLTSELRQQREDFARKTELQATMIRELRGRKNQPAAN